MIAYKIHGNGAERVLMMHDWSGDSSNYDNLLPYLDAQKYTYALVDLRGYGQSKAIAGEFNVDEAAQDVLAVADQLAWNQFHLVGHSMSGMIAQRIALIATPRLKSVVAISPVPAGGSPAPLEIMNFMTDAAKNNDVAAKQAFGFMTGDRLCAKFVDMKVAKWRECSTQEARLGYLNMFVNTDFSKDVMGLETPFLVIAGEHDIPDYQMPRLQETFGKWLKNVELVECKNSAHYPMQETPVYLATLLEAHFAKHV